MICGFYTLNFYLADQFYLLLQTSYNLLQNEVSFTVFPLILKSPAAGGMMLYLWHLNPNLVLRGFVEADNVESHIMTKILEVCQEIKVNGENL